MKFPYKIIDLTHTLSPQVPSWNGSCGFQHEVKLDYSETTTEFKFRVQQIKMHAGIGTHIDAPSHCFENGKSVSDLKLEHLIAPCFVIDVSSRASTSYSVSAGDIIEFEKQYGGISPESLVIIHTGWGKFWHNSDLYKNDFQYPSISEEASLLLLERKVNGIGVDTLSPDRPADGFPVHRNILGAGKYIIENVANSGAMPAVGGYSLALPIKAEGCTEAPIRLIGLIKDLRTL